MPVEAPAEAKPGDSPESHTITYQRQTRDVPASAGAPVAADADRVMLIRKRKSRIYFLRQFFDYPIRLSADTAEKTGPDAYRENRCQLHPEFDPAG